MELLILLLLSSGNFIVEELLLLLSNLLLHLIQFLLSILNDVVNFAIFNFRLNLLVFLLHLSVDFVNLLKLLLHNIFGFFSESGAGTLENITLFWP